MDEQKAKDDFNIANRRFFGHVLIDVEKKKNKIQPLQEQLNEKNLEYESYNETQKQQWLLLVGKQMLPNKNKTKEMITPTIKQYAKNMSTKNGLQLEGLKQSSIKPSLQIGSGQSQKKFAEQLNQACRKQRVRTQIWDDAEVVKIFHLYHEYGSQWKLISQEFDDRASNSIKNRFYTTVRILLKNLFRQHPSIPHKLPHEISSKLILKFYEGQAEFNRFKGLGKKIMKKIGYNVESPLLPQIAQNSFDDIMGVYKVIYTSSKQPKQTKTKKVNVPRCMEKQKDKKIEAPLQDFQQQRSKTQSNQNIIFENNQVQKGEKTFGPFFVSNVNYQIMPSFYVPNNAVMFYPYNFTYSQFL